MTKTQKVLNHLQTRKTITSIEAFNLYNATRLSAIVFNLRHRGYDISTCDMETQDEDGRTIRYARYILRSEG